MKHLIVVLLLIILPFIAFSSGIQDEDLPWKPEITILAKSAIFKSIQNLSKPLSERDSNFPKECQIGDFPYIDSQDFKVVGYSSITNTDLYVIEFHGSDFMGFGPRITVEIDIETGEVFSVFILADS